MHNFTFCGGREHKTTTLFFFSWTLIHSLLEFNSRKHFQHLTNWTRWIKRDKVWSSATSLFKWRFRSRRCRSCSRSLFTWYKTAMLEGNGCTGTRQTKEMTIFLKWIEFSLHLVLVCPFLFSVAVFNTCMTSCKRAYCHLELSQQQTHRYWTRAFVRRQVVSRTPATPLRH